MCLNCDGQGRRRGGGAEEQLQDKVTQCLMSVSQCSLAVTHFGSQIFSSDLQPLVSEPGVSLGFSATWRRRLVRNRPQWDQ